MMRTIHIKRWIFFRHRYTVDRTSGVDLFRSLGGHGSGLRNFQFHQKVSDFPKEFRFSRLKFPTPIFLVNNSKMFHLSQKLPFTPTFLPNFSSFSWIIITFQQHTFSPKYDIVFSQTRPRPPYNSKDHHSIKCGGSRPPNSPRIELIAIMNNIYPWNSDRIENETMLIIIKNNKLDSSPIAHNFTTTDILGRGALGIELSYLNRGSVMYGQTGPE